MSEKTSTDLVPHQPGTVLTSPHQFTAYVAQARANHAHVLSPVTDIGAMPENWVFVPSAVYINPDEAGGEVYRDSLFCKNDEVALTKVGLRKIAKAAGISWRVRRTDLGTVDHYWEFTCEISYRGHDGLPKTEEASYPWDLRGTSTRVTMKKADGTSMSERELSRARLHGYRRCEAGAINAAIREYGLKQKYTKTELARPFVVFNLVFVPETPEQKAMLAQAALGGTATLYGGQALPLPEKGATVDPVTGELVEEDDKKAPATAAAATHTTLEVPFDDSLDEKPEPALKVVSVTQVGNTDQYYVTVSSGQKLYTTAREVAKACNDARKAGAAVVFDLEKKGEVLTILEATVQPVPTTAGKY
jgi:hypothetical protein